MTTHDRFLVAEAFVLLVLVQVSFWILPLPSLQRLLRYYGRGSHSGAVRGADPADPARTAIDTRIIRRVGWAVMAVARRFPGGATNCLVQALVAEAVLRRRGLRPALCLGVQTGNKGSAPLVAHAWVVCDGAIVVGALENLAEYSILSTPGQP